MLFRSILFGLFAVVLFGIAYQYLSYISKTPWMVDLVVHSVTNNNVTAFFCYVRVLFEFHAYFFYIAVLIHLLSILWKIHLIAGPLWVVVFIWVIYSHWDRWCKKQDWWLECLIGWPRRSRNWWWHCWYANSCEPYPSKAFLVHFQLKVLLKVVSLSPNNAWITMTHD